MKALSVKQPWVNLILMGKKSIETRTWQAKFRGDLLICSSIKDVRIDSVPKLAKNALAQLGLMDFYQGYGVCVAELYSIELMTVEHEHLALCPVYPNAYAWHLRNVRMVEPVPVKGQLGLFNVEDSLIKFI